MKLGLDIGSTTIKCVVLDDENKLIYSTYERHYSRITEKIAEILALVRTKIDGVENAAVALSGSAGMGVAESVGIDFIQEVYATRVAANTFIPGTDVVIELGGEDAKILFLTNGLEVRMNGTCAGGTGAFIDQMATLLNVKLEDMDELAKQHEKTYTIASRCGVFAKTDIQPLLNQGARKSDIAESIFNAVVSQTVAGLAQGREIEGQIVYLGGPLTFMSELRNCFDRTLGTKGICPENSLYYVASGAALCAEKTIDFDKVIEKVKNYRGSGNFAFNQPLFNNEEEYRKFCDRHARADVKQKELKGYKGKAYIGMDAGSTTVKGVVLNDDGELLYSKYLPSKGSPVEIMKGFLDEIYEINPEINVVSSAVTGYGEDIIKMHLRLITVWLKQLPTLPPQNTLCPMLNLSLTSAVRISSALRYITVQLTTFSLTRLVHRAAEAFCRPLQTLSAMRLPTLQSSDFLQSDPLTSVHAVPYL